MKKNINNDNNINKLINALDSNKIQCPKCKTLFTYKYHDEDFKLNYNYINKRNCCYHCWVEEKSKENELIKEKHGTS